MREWIDDHRLEIGVVALCVFLLVACLWAAEYEDATWKQYAKDHHCVARGTKKGQIVINNNGTTGTTPDQTIFVCDGEEIVIR